MSDQAVAIDQKFVAFGLAAKDWMIIQYQTGLAFASLALKNQRRRKPADTSAHDHTIIAFSGVDHVRWQVFKGAIANLVAALEHHGGVAVGLRVVADAAITSPVIGRSIPSSLR